jgi:ATPase
MRKIPRPTRPREKLRKVVPDTSLLIHGKLTKLIKAHALDGADVIIPEIVMAELQGLAARSKEQGFAGLDEVKRARELAPKHKIAVRFVGERPSYEDILLAKSGRIDALIQDVAKEQRAVLLTCDLPQALVAEAAGISVKFYEIWERAKKIKLQDFLTPDTMSVHLKEGAIPLAKRGRPGAFKLIPLTDKRMEKEELEAIAKEILDAARYEPEAFVEYSEHGAAIVQLRGLRIAIARPPFSNGLEITAVRPIVKLTLDDYRLSDKLKDRLAVRAEGILIAGPPGGGKTCFASSLAEFYLAQGKVVKTMECPRDLIVPPEITQYGPLDGSFAKTADMLLMVRPDYTIFDEIRKSKDFETFADMRLAGVGMVGVVHATDPIDAIQRFIPRVELGVIPHVIDTIIFIKDGAVKRVYSLSLTVRVPSGMTEADLARPVVEVRDFETGKLEYEIYTYGEQTAVVAVPEERKPVHRLAAERVLQEVKRYDPTATVELISEDRVIVRVRNEAIPKLIGKEGKTIRSIEDRLGINIEVEPTAETFGKEVRSELTESGSYMILRFAKRLAGKNANVYIDSEYLFTATVGRKGEIKVSKSSDLGKALLRAATTGRVVKVFT